MDVLAQRIMQYDDKDVTADIIERSVRERLWGEVRNYGQSLACINTFQNRLSTGATSSKKFEWAYGEYEVTYDVLAIALNKLVNGSNPLAAASYSTGGNPGVIALTKDMYVSEDIVHLDNGTYWLKIRLFTNTGGNVWTFEVIDTNIAAANQPNFLTTDPIVMNLSSTRWGENARKGLNYIPTVIHNWCQSHRDSIIKSHEEQGQATLADTSLSFLAMKALREATRKFNYSLHTSYSALNGQNGIFGGLPFVFNPANRTQVAVAGGRENLLRGISTDGVANPGMYGINKLYATGGTIALSDLDDYMLRVTEYGNMRHEKIAFLSPSMFNIIKESMYGQVQIERGIFGSINPAFESAWEMPFMEFSYGKLFFCVDRSLGNIRNDVVDIDRLTNNAGYRDRWMVVVDPEHTALVPMSIKGRTDTLGIQPMENNDIRNQRSDELEVTCSYTLAVTDPRTGGYVSFEDECVESEGL